MKFLAISMIVLLGASVQAAEEETLKITTTLSSEESYKLYEHLSIPEVADPDGRRLVKRTDTVVCVRSGFYPGDREYECTVSLSVNKDGSIEK